MTTKAAKNVQNQTLMLTRQVTPVDASNSFSYDMQMP